MNRKAMFEKDLDIGIETKTYTKAPNGRYYRLEQRSGCFGCWTYHNGSSKAIFYTQSLGTYFRSFDDARAWALMDGMN
jgi:hypothetical protein